MIKVRLFLLLTAIFLYSIDAEGQSKGLIKQPCNRELEPSIEIWSFRGNANLIGTYYEKFENKYLQTFEGWSKDDNPYPKKFDIKVLLMNNLRLYENETNIGSYLLNVNLKLKVGQSPDALYPLNSRIVENIELVKNKSIKEKDFSGLPKDTSYFELWIKDIVFEDLYNKYKEQGLYINQLIFEIDLIESSRKNICHYEYTFEMEERGEP